MTVWFITKTSFMIGSSKNLACGDLFRRFCTVCLLAFGSPGGKRRKESLAAQGSRNHRTCRWFRNESQRAAALRHFPNKKAGTIIPYFPCEKTFLKIFLKNKKEFRGMSA
ncbi:MAG: hypothetical protein IKJ26_11580 [Clostridia bacterium]|nr:hypothetical protein [Clostridia bacterium]